MKYEVYKIQNKLNNKIYIGITNKGYRRRFKHHCSEMRNGSTFILHNAMRKYGIENFESTLLETVGNAELLKEREKFWIESLDTINRDKGYNMTLGGDGTFGRYHSAETKEKIRQKAQNRVYNTLTVKIKNLDTNKVDIFLNLSKASTFLGKNKAYLTHQKNKFNSNCFIIDNLEIEFIVPEKVLKKKESNFDTKSHLKRIQKLAEIAKKEHFEEYKETQRLAKLETGKTKIVQQYSLEGEFINEYLGTREAAKAVNGQRSPIKNCLKGKTKMSYSYIWKYK